MQLWQAMYNWSKFKSSLFLKKKHKLTLLLRIPPGAEVPKSAKLEH